MRGPPGKVDIRLSLQLFCTSVHRAWRRGHDLHTHSCTCKLLYTTQACLRAACKALLAKSVKAHCPVVAGPWGKLVENISGKLAFFPPRPSTYRVEEHKDGTGELYIQPQQGCVHLQCTSAWLSAAPRFLIIVSIVLQGHSARAPVLCEEDPNSAYKEGRSWRRLNYCDSVCAMPLGLNTSQDHRPLLPWQRGGSGADASCVQVGAGSLSSITKHEQWKRA